jgi:hypothetical protein
MNDEHIGNSVTDLFVRCVDCGTDFMFTIGEQMFYRDRQLTPAKRCKACRRARRQLKRPQDS